MKKIFSLAMAAAVAFGLASCSKDVDYGNNGPDEGDLVATFTLQTPSSAFVTYADQIAEGAEWTLNNIDVYAFENGAMVNNAKLIKDTDYEVTSATGAATTTIKVKTSWLAPLAGKDVTFYFVGNDVAGANGAVKAPHVEASKTAQADFEKQITEELDVNGDSKINEIIRTPLLFSAKSEVVSLVGRVQAKATLTRREARFDILNKHAAVGAPNNLEVTAIKISNAPRSGKIFADGGTDVISWAGIDHTKIAVPAYPANYAEETDPKAPTEKTYRAKSVFYLYPTIVGESVTHTEITIEAAMGGKNFTFTRAKNDAQGNAIAPKEIVANYRYTLVLDPLSLTFDIEKADYTDGGEVETVAGGDDTFAGFAFNLSESTMTNVDNWDETTGIYKFDDNDADKLVFDVETKYGTVAEVNYVLGNEADVTFSVPAPVRTVTYVGYKTVEKYTIPVPQSEAEGSFHITVTIKSPNGSAKKVITFSKGKLTEDDIKEIFENNEVLGDIVTEVLAGLGAGSTLADITTITGTGANGPSSLEGLENLPNVTSINFGYDANSYNMNLSGNLDFSFAPQLTSINLTGCPNVTEVNVANNPNLTSLTVFATGITTLDVSNNPGLEVLSLGGTNLAEIDLTNNKKLKTLQIAGTPLSSIDFDLPELTTIYFGRSTNIDMPAYTTINWSGMPNITSMFYYGSFGDKLDASVGLSHPKVATLTVQNYMTNSTPDRSMIPTVGYDLIKTVDLSGMTNIETATFATVPNLTSVTGTEALTKLNRLTFSLDYQMVEMGLQQNIKESLFNLSESNTLTILAVNYTDIKNITLPALPALTTLQTNVCHYLEKLDVTNAPALKTMAVRNANVLPASIDISNNQALTSLDLRHINQNATSCTIKGWVGMSTNPLPFTLTKNSLATVNWE